MEEREMRRRIKVCGCWLSQPNEENTRKTRNTQSFNDRSTVTEAVFHCWKAAYRGLKVSRNLQALENIFTRIVYGFVLVSGGGPVGENYWFDRCVMWKVGETSVRTQPQTKRSPAATQANGFTEELSVHKPGSLLHL
jgi:hypothetical protein